MWNHIYSYKRKKFTRDSKNYFCLLIGIFDAVNRRHRLLLFSVIPFYFHFIFSFLYSLDSIFQSLLLFVDFVVVNDYLVFLLIIFINTDKQDNIHAQSHTQFKTQSIRCEKKSSSSFISEIVSCQKKANTNTNKLKNKNRNQRQAQEAATEWKRKE